MSEQPERWISLRDRHGNLQGRYCPEKQLLLIRVRRETTAHDLSVFSGQVDGDSTDVLESSGNALGAFSVAGTE